ncbi:adenylate/guanylate cyclase domain-containing protein [Frankia sp. CcI49]|uniref:adenylate/guanylate cyclase domain-containing protein n=1 Tax=Frankia sp. CcI49 TaxID=1745382 RepID=UPI000977331C|nr:adenylate/guanylate cyclase domain-containing protein [Frankia sp. CcI49]ONH58608.1 adenylate/guanylate cyclase domain-containing protein [Frankia sp. CcI49]
METTTVLVVDLVGSTRAMASVPRVRMTEMMTEAVLPIRRIVEELGGEIIKFTGDGYLTAFRSATDSLHAAAQIVNLFISGPRLPIGDWVEGCRVAIHTCDTIRFENDLLGEGVVVPARMEKHVPTNEVYVTSTTRDAAKSAEFGFDLVGELALNGIPRPVQVHRLLADRYRGIERNAFLTVTDLVGLNALAARVSLTTLNERLHRWVELHHEALGTTHGRLRSVAGDNILATHDNADDAAAFLIALDRLSRLPADPPTTARTNQPDEADQPDDADGADEAGQPPFAFSAVIAHGDLFVPDFGLAGPLVSSTCRTLQALSPGTKIVTSAVLQRLTCGQAAFGQVMPPAPGDGVVGEYHLFIGAKGRDS